MTNLEKELQGFDTVPSAKTVPALTQARLKEVLDYNPEVGIWRWRVHMGPTKVGNIAGYVDPRSKVLGIRIDGKMQSASRLAFLYMNGEWPQRTVVNDGNDKSVCKWNDLRVAWPRVSKGMKRPPATSREEWLERRHESFSKWYKKTGPRPSTPEGRKRSAANQARYRKSNPEAVCAAKNIRRSRIIGAGGTHTAQDLREILQAQRNRCAYCKIKLTRKNKHLDHIIALASGGTNDRRNLQFLCSFCNQKKSAKDPVVFCRQQGMLL